MLNNIVDFKEAKLKLLIENTKKYISEYKPIEIKSLEYFKNYGLDEIRTYFKKVDNDDNENLYIEILSYIFFTSKYGNKFKLIKEANSELKVKAEEALNILNNKLKRYNTLSQERINKINNDLKIIEIINDFLYQDNSYNTSYEELANIIYTEKFSPDVIVNLSELIARKQIELAEKTRENEVDEFEETLFEITNSNIKLTDNYYYIMQLIEENELNSLNDDITISSDLYLNIEEFNEILNSSYIDTSDFSMVLSNILYYMDKEQNEEKLKEYKELSKNFIFKYKKISEIEAEIETLKDKIMFFFNQNINNNDYTSLTDISIKLEETKIKFRNGVEIIEELERLKYTLSQIIDEQNDVLEMEQSNVKIKSLVLFDGNINENNEIVPYINSDLDKNNQVNMIDPSIGKEKIENSYKDLNELIEDLTIYDAPRVTIGNSDKLNKIVTSVFRKNKKGEVVRTLKNDTGMKRIRPTTSSNVRFIDEKFTFKKEFESYKEIVEIIKEVFPYVEIDERENFSIYLNFVSGFKLKDEDGYTKAILRQKESYQRQFLEEISSKKELTDLDRERLREILNVAKQTYQDLKELNQKLEFASINKMMGGYSNQWL